MKLNLIVLSLFIISGSTGVVAYGHTIDSVGDYRVEIGWMNEPVVSGETNAIEFYVSPLATCPDISDLLKCAGSQEFENGISDLAKTIKIQLIYKDENITLPLSVDHDIPGKYYAFVNPTVSGFYQANILGTIIDTPISLSMHPPKVNERSHIEFPEPSDITITQMIDGHTALIGDVNDLKESIKKLDQNQTNDMVYAWIIVGFIGIVLAIIIAIIAILKSKKN